MSHDDDENLPDDEIDLFFDEEADEGEETTRNNSESQFPRSSTNSLENGGDLFGRISEEPKRKKKRREREQEMISKSIEQRASLASNGGVRKPRKTKNNTSTRKSVYNKVIPGPVGEYTMLEKQQQELNLYGAEDVISDRHMVMFTQEQQKYRQVQQRQLMNRNKVSNLPTTTAAGKFLDFKHNKAWKELIEYMKDREKKYLSQSGNSKSTLERFNINYIKNENGYFLKVPILGLLVRSVIRYERDTAYVKLSDPSGTIEGTIEGKVNEEFPDILTPGAVVLLKKVSVYCPSELTQHVIITMSNIVQIFINTINPSYNATPNISTNSMRSSLFSKQSKDKGKQPLKPIEKEEDDESEEDQQAHESQNNTKVQEEIVNQLKSVLPLSIPNYSKERDQPEVEIDSEDDLFEEAFKKPSLSFTKKKQEVVPSKPLRSLQNSNYKEENKIDASFQSHKSIQNTPNTKPTKETPKTVKTNLMDINRDNITQQSSSVSDDELEDLLDFDKNVSQVTTQKSQIPKYTNESVTKNISIDDELFDILDKSEEDTSNNKAQGVVKKEKINQPQKERRTNDDELDDLLDDLEEEEEESTNTRDRKPIQNGGESEQKSEIIDMEDFDISDLL